MSVAVQRPAVISSLAKVQEMRLEKFNKKILT